MRSLPITAATGDAVPAPPAARPDIRDEDLVPFLRAFYDAIERDPLLAPYFVGLDMEEHIPRIADFWSTMVFQTRRYTGNAFLPHAAMPGLTAEHFAHWIATLERIVDDRYAGPRAELVKSLAHRVAYSMQLRLGIAPFAELPRADRGG